MPRFNATFSVTLRSLLDRSPYGPSPLCSSLVGSSPFGSSLFVSPLVAFVARVLNVLDVALVLPGFCASFFVPS